MAATTTERLSSTERGRSGTRDGLLASRRSVDEGLIPEHEYLEAVAARQGTSVESGPPSPYLAPVAEEVPTAFMEEFLLVPVRRLDRGSCEVLAAREVDDGTRRELVEVFGAGLEVRMAPKASVLELVRSLYDPSSDGERAVSTPGRAADGGESESVEDLANQPPVVRFVSFIVQEAFRRRASDVHLEAMEDEFKVRYRVDGELREVTTPPREYRSAVIARIKVLADLDVTERRRPQDGRIRLAVDGRAIDLRVSTVPTLHGESVVMRLLDQESIRLSLEELGLAPDVLTRVTRLIERPHGILLVTGPTGSGKTTTLYAALEKLNRPERKILTVEDPVEYQLPGINQMPVRPDIGLTFAKALRSLLRQDPDIIMVGEMRDFETAEIAIQAALTGHLVLSTLHTNDAPGGVTRLLEMGVEPYLVSSTLTAILAQRLVRTLCDECAQPAPPDELPAESSGLPAPAGSGAPRVPGGCEACEGLGYRGRTGVFELMELDDDLREAVDRRAPLEELRRICRAKGVRTLQGDGMRKAGRGETTAREVLRVTWDESGEP